MAPRARPDLLPYKKELARLIAREWEEGQTADGGEPSNGTRRWTAETLALAVDSTSRTVNDWRNERRPRRPP